MCGIVAVLARPSTRRPPALDEALTVVDRALAVVAEVASDGSAGSRLTDLEVVAEALSALDASLRGVPGLRCLLSAASAVDDLETGASRLATLVGQLEAGLDSGALAVEPDRLERLNAVLIALQDVSWALGRDRVAATRAVADLLSGLAPAGDALAVGDAGLTVLWSIQVALASLDRLEVRGRDSAGVHVLLAQHELDLQGDPALRIAVAERSADPLFCSGALRVHDGCLSLVYKAAAEIGELGDNVRALRAAIRCDPVLARALSAPSVQATVLAHTRWASVGIISQANAHPLNSDEAGRSDGPYVLGALNGDVDNHIELRTEAGLAIPDEVTTDAKVIPTLLSRALAEHGDASVTEVFGATVARFEGSVAVGVSTSVEPDRLYLALRGSGQSLNIGLSEDAFVVASEPYGLVEETPRYLRMEGERGGGQLVVLSRTGAGQPQGIERLTYAGDALPVTPADITTAAITTRDVDRQGHPHFLIKEISEAPRSLRKTLRGKIVEGPGGRRRVVLGPDSLPDGLRQALAGGYIRRVIAIGQGTAAVAAQAVADAVARALPALVVRSTLATELSGWGLDDDMSDTLVVAVSQSGTTTDTNRTVDLARARGALIVAIVNRRSSDLVEKAHGVLYTSDGRDVEMSVASTKAFYAQVAAGQLLALALAEAAGLGADERSDELLGALRDLPASMERVLAMREAIGRIAAAVAPPRRSWAVVGSGPERVAAAEVRIKLSELCYKAIPCDAIEDKKHIDLSSEPLVLVCAASLTGANASDVAKEVAIFKAHKAAPVVVVAEGAETRLGPGIDTIAVPSCPPELAFVLSAMAGHLFAYEAALAIDAQARPLRLARSVLESGTPAGRRDVAQTERVGAQLERALAPAFAGLRAGAYDGHLSPSVAARLTSLARYASGLLPVEAYEMEMGKVGTPAAIAADLLKALDAGIDELTRPIDAIKHQAKTVTVGISRSEEALVGGRLVREVLAAGAPLDCLGYRALRTLAALDAAVVEVTGFTRYRLDVDDGSIAVVDQGGSARGLPSRTTTDHRLRGTKHQVARSREVTVFRGAQDGRTGMMVPEVKDAQVIGLTLLHARFVPRLEADAMRALLRAYRGRYSALADAVTETEPTFDDARLGHLDVVDLLTEPVAALAASWRGLP
jgi:glucosamine--fructose-6-phosphate aminotransferase (isomerizing)